MDYAVSSRWFLYGDGETAYDPVLMCNSMIIFPDSSEVCVLTDDILIPTRFSQSS